MTVETTAAAIAAFDRVQTIVEKTRIPQFANVTATRSPEGGMGLYLVPPGNFAGSLLSFYCDFDGEIVATISDRDSRLNRKTDVRALKTTDDIEDAVLLFEAILFPDTAT